MVCGLEGAMAREMRLRRLSIVDSGNPVAAAAKVCPPSVDFRIVGEAKGRTVVLVQPPLVQFAPSHVAA